MPPERVTITIRSSVGDDGTLSVADGLRQILDFFDLLTAAQGGSDGDVVAWRLVSISKNSPLTATAEAYATMTGVAPEIVARRGKERVERAFGTMTAGLEPPEWLEGMALSKTRSILARNLNGIGRTDINYERVNLTPTILVEKTARTALNAIEKMEVAKRAAVEDLSRSEIGSIEGTVAAVTRHYGRPAIDVRESLRGQTIRCNLSDEAAEDMKSTHTWGEAWEGQRVSVSGEIVYKKDGSLSRVNNAHVELIVGRSINHDEIARPGILGGLTPREYLDKLWGENDDG